ncbi:MAG: reverse transcriptase domain-containing protein [Cellulomonas sp.]|nr:reverse transcriptase domain-containing protein [Cellulomonas sp.]MCR6646644.1 reverse transcriptase domain-containing protein [Cellulomonas sp.]
MSELSRDIHQTATEKVRAHERRRKSAHDEWVRRQRRTTTPLRKLDAREPEFWLYDSSHSPFHVRAKSATIAHAIERKIQSGTYTPLPPAGFVVPKAGGKSRTVTTFAIADEVVSRRLYTALLSKNRSRLSAHSYAYRKDLGVHDAIAHIESEWRSEHRLFVAQYDFTDYFGSIDHEHVLRTIEYLGLAISRTERRLLRAFLSAPLPTLLPARMPTSAPARRQGIHQGTSISLLIANIAATPLDREFERLGVSFARYADDIVIWSRDYTNINRAVDELHRFAEHSGNQINFSKSPGVQLLTAPEAMEGELRTTHHIEFLSNRVGLRSVAISSRTLDLAKDTASKYIYDHLLREPLAGRQDLRRLAGGIDRDYIALLTQLRRHLYGNLSEHRLRRLLRGPLPPRMTVGGILGRHPLANDLGQLKEFDAWLTTQVWLALRKRSTLLAPHVGRTPKPWGLNAEQLMAFMTHSTKGKMLLVDGRLPSLVRMSELVRRAVRVRGTRVARHTPSLYGWG